MDTNLKCENKEKADPFPDSSSVSFEGTKEETFQAAGSPSRSKRRVAAKRAELEMEMEKRVWKRRW